MTQPTANDIENQALSQTQKLFGSGGFFDGGAGNLLKNTGKVAKDVVGGIRRENAITTGMTNTGGTGVSGRISVLKGLMNDAFGKGDYNTGYQYMSELQALEEAQYALDPSYFDDGSSGGSGGGGGGGGIDPLSALAMIYSTAVDVGSMKAGAAAKALENQLAQAELTQQGSHVMGFEPGGMANRFFGTGYTPFDNDIGKYTKVQVDDPNMIMDQMNSGFNDIVSQMQAYFGGAGGGVGGGVASGGGAAGSYYTPPVSEASGTPQAAGAPPGGMSNEMWATIQQDMSNFAPQGATPPSPGAGTISPEQYYPPSATGSHFMPPAQGGGGGPSMPSGISSMVASFLMDGAANAVPGGGAARSILRGLF